MKYGYTFHLSLGTIVRIVKVRELALRVEGKNSQNSCSGRVEKQAEALELLFA